MKRYRGYLALGVALLAGCRNTESPPTSGLPSRDGTTSQGPGGAFSGPTGTATNPSGASATTGTGSASPSGGTVGGRAGR